MPNTFSMAPRYVRDFAARTAFASPRARRLRRPRGQARPALPPAAARRSRASPCSATPATSRPRAAAALREPRPARPGAPRRDLAALPAGREVRLLQLAADLVPRLRRARPSTRRSTTPITASRTSRSCATSWPACGRSWPTTPSSSSSSATSRPTADAASRGGVGLAERAFEQAAEPEGYRLAGVALDDVAAVRKMTKLWGDEAGRATKTDRILVLGATEAGRRRALAGAVARRRLDLAAEARCAPSDAGRAAPATTIAGP